MGCIGREMLTLIFCNENLDGLGVSVFNIRTHIWNLCGTMEYLRVLIERYLIILGHYI